MPLLANGTRRSARMWCGIAKLYHPKAVNKEVKCHLDSKQEQHESCLGSTEHGKKAEVVIQRRTFSYERIAQLFDRMDRLNVARARTKLKARAVRTTQDEKRWMGKVVRTVLGHGKQRKPDAHGMEDAVASGATSAHSYFTALGFPEETSRCRVQLPSSPVSISLPRSHPVSSSYPHPSLQPGSNGHSSSFESTLHDATVPSANSKFICVPPCSIYFLPSPQSVGKDTLAKKTHDPHIPDALPTIDDNSAPTGLTTQTDPDTDALPGLENSAWSAFPHVLSPFLRSLMHAEQCKDQSTVSGRSVSLNKPPRRRSSAMDIDESPAPARRKATLDAEIRMETDPLELADVDMLMENAEGSPPTFVVQSMGHPQCGSALVSNFLDDNTEMRDEVERAGVVDVVVHAFTAVPESAFPPIAAHHTALAHPSTLGQAGARALTAESVIALDSMTAGTEERGVGDQTAAAAGSLRPLDLVNVQPIPKSVMRPMFAQKPDVDQRITLPSLPKLETLSLPSKPVLDTANTNTGRTLLTPSRFATLPPLRTSARVRAEEASTIAAPGPIVTSGG